MSDNQFTPHKSYFKNKQVSIPSLLIRDKKLSDGAFRFLLYLTTNSETWKVYQSYVMEELGWGEKKLRAAIKELVEKRYLIVTEQRGEKGRFSNSSYEFSLFPIEKEDEKQEDSNNFTVPPSTEDGSTELRQGSPTLFLKEERKLEEEQTNPTLSKRGKLASSSPEEKEYMRKILLNFEMIQVGYPTKLKFTVEEVDKILDQYDVNRIRNAAMYMKDKKKIHCQKAYFINAIYKGYK